MNITWGLRKSPYAGLKLCFLLRGMGADGTGIFLFGNRYLRLYWKWQIVLTFGQRGSGQTHTSEKGIQIRDWSRHIRVEDSAKICGDREVSSPIIQTKNHNQTKKNPRTICSNPALSSRKAIQRTDLFLIH